MTASGLFALYTELDTYGRLYGSLAGVVVFLVWLWVANLALLAGAQFNAERARQAPQARWLETLGPSPGSPPV